MKTRNLMAIVLAIIGVALLTTPAVMSQTCDGTGKNFVDLNGDGFNDNAPDHDGDGIPNGLDPDYVKYAQDGDGYQNGKMHANQFSAKAQSRSTVSVQRAFQLKYSEGSLFQHRFGALGGMNGSFNGFGGGAGFGTGVCDGTGPHGAQNRGGK